MTEFHGGVIFVLIGLSIALWFGAIDFIAVAFGSVIATIGLFSIKYIPSLIITW